MGRKAGERDGVGHRTDGGIRDDLAAGNFDGTIAGGGPGNGGIGGAGFGGAEAEGLRKFVAAGVKNDLRRDGEFGGGALAEPPGGVAEGGEGE